ncbi:MAG: PorP/SprF family type IX secretion system membrane protein [Cytophagales bacterium]|nr:PorP/SprF family type IX secretion system membrane protein [Cytophagales bacterium]
MPWLSDAQDQDFTQFYHTPVYINPAAVGHESVPRATLGYRNQWSSIVGNFTAFQAAIDSYFRKYNSGVGLMVSNSQAGVGGLYSTDLMAMYSYRANLGKEWALALGLQAGYVFRGATYYQYVFGDQLSLSGDFKSASDENISQTNSLNYFDAGVGAQLFKDGTQIGVSVYHLTGPNQSLTGNISRLPIKLNVVVSYRILLQYRSTRQEEFYTSITPMAYFRMQGPFKQLNIGAMLDYTPLQFGLFYRGLPLVSVDGVANSDALALAAGLRYKGIIFGYSYDITLSGLTNRSGGSHEFQVGYVLESAKPFQPKKRFKKNKK